MAHFSLHFTPPRDNYPDEADPRLGRSLVLDRGKAMGLVTGGGNKTGPNNGTSSL
jgi:hypothetical protein